MICFIIFSTDRSHLGLLKPDAGIFLLRSFKQSLIWFIQKNKMKLYLSLNRSCSNLENTQPLSQHSCFICFLPLQLHQISEECLRLDVNEKSRFSSSNEMTSVAKFSIVKHALSVNCKIRLVQQIFITCYFSDVNDNLTQIRKEWGSSIIVFLTDNSA